MFAGCIKAMIISSEATRTKATWIVMDRWASDYSSKKKNKDDPNLMYKLPACHSLQTIDGDGECAIRKRRLPNSCRER